MLPAYKRDLNGHAPSPETPASYYYGDEDFRPPAPEDVSEKLKQAQKTTVGRVADLISNEVEERRNMIGGIDNFWLLLQDITDFNPACTSVFFMRGKVTVDDLAEQLTRQAAKFPRFRQKLHSVGRLFRGASFVEDPDFDVRNHIHRRSLPEPAGKAELDALVGKIVAEGWGLSRPLWDMMLVDNYHDENGAVCAVVARGHHTLSDGQGFVISQLYLTSYFEDLSKMMDNAVDKLSKAKRGLLLPSEYSKSLKSLDPYAADHPAAPLVHLFLALLFWMISVLQACRSHIWSTYQALRMIAFFLFTFWRVEMVTPEQPHGRTPSREFSSSRVFRMQDVKLVQQAFSGPRPGYAVAGVPKEQRRTVRSKKGHVTLNDVVCSVMADVLGNIVATKPEPSSPIGTFRRAVNKVLPNPMGFFIPISIRQPGDWSMRNLSTAANVYLKPANNLSSDISVREIHAHIHRCRYELNLFKHSNWPKFVFHVMQYTGQAPVVFPPSWFGRSQDWNPLTRLFRVLAVRPAVDAALESFTAILTNIPGPQKPITMNGVEVAHWVAIPPQAGAGTLAIGIMSYAGGIAIALSADAVPGGEGIAQRICVDFERRFELYLARAKEVLEHQD